MALLSLEKRKEYFEYLGLGKYNKSNILKMQKKYLLRPSDWDGIYGKDTDSLLRHLRNCKKYASKNFKPEEFRCGCNGRFCCGYPTRMKAKELAHIQAIRTHFGKPMIITSGLRCERYNSEVGGIQDSRHKTGYAVDFVVKGLTDTLAGRKKVIKYAMKLKNHHYSYGNGCKTSDNKIVTIYAPTMGNAVHTDTK